MPRITIEITEQMEAKIADAIRCRRDFIIDGGCVSDGEKLVSLKSIKFSFQTEDPDPKVK